MKKREYAKNRYMDIPEEEKERKKKRTSEKLS